ncbi:MAG: HAD family phosphatase [Gemmataceae bacterium]|nr:HAD family phosphatase [Gemmataceae bacterium]
MIRALLFDFGNVLGYFDHRRATRRFAARAAMSDGDMLRAIYDGSLERDFESGRITGMEFLSQVRELIGYSGPLDDLQSEFVDIFTPNTPILELLPSLARRYRLVLASNTNELHAEHFCRTFDEHLRHFHALGMSWKAGVRKPDAPFFEYCLGLAECSPDEAVFVDDLPANVAGAESAGIRGIVYRPGTNLMLELNRLGVNLA